MLNERSLNLARGFTPLAAHASRLVAILSVGHCSDEDKRRVPGTRLASMHPVPKNIF